MTLYPDHMFFTSESVAEGHPDKFCDQISVDPVSVMVNTYGTGTLPEDVLAAMVRQVFPLSPNGMIDHLHLRRPGYVKTAA